MFDRKEYRKNYYQKNKEKLKGYRKKRYQKNKEKEARNNKQWRKDNPEKVKLLWKQYYKENRDRELKRKKIWRENNRDKLKEYAENRKKNNPNYMKEWYQKNRIRIIERKIQWQKNNPEIANKNSRKWRENNPEYFVNYRKNNKNKLNIWMKNKRKTNIKCNLNHRVSTAIDMSLKGNKNGRQWESLVDYSMLDLKTHLQKTMPKGYTWQDYLEGKLHIDHIIPKSAFNFDKPEDINFKKCWALENLRLLPATENIRKSNKLIKPFQQILEI
jgi:hypothetical protein